jgi:hypothetical protein
MKHTRTTRFLKSKDLKIGMDYFYSPRIKGKYVITRIWDIEYYTTITNKDAIRIYFDTQKSRRSKMNSLHKVFEYTLLDEGKLPPVTDFKLKQYFESLAPYKYGSDICTCGMIVPKGSIWHDCILDNVKK